MEIVSFMIQGGIGSIFAIYGICSLLSNRKTVLPPVCILVGISLLGYAVSQIL